MEAAGIEPSSDAGHRQKSRHPLAHTPRGTGRVRFVTTTMRRGRGRRRKIRAS